ncbi:MULTISPECIES: hypothetical protein [Halorussus]|uniref:hypothetical protein n=1 Tax=Halorussus TaxID=1070314 RepID=UPI0020A1D842|nr:hypothetical protein [Halorussus vallis]USZ78618.1 hypothetical protein NGM07_25045 [Halorussus vallis]
MPEIKASIDEETLQELRERYPDAMSDAERFRIILSVNRDYERILRSSAKEAFLEGGISDLEDEDVLESAIKDAVKELILESDQFDFEDLARLTQSEDSE